MGQGQAQSIIRTTRRSRLLHHGPPRSRLGRVASATPPHKQVGPGILPRMQFLMQFVAEFSLGYTGGFNMATRRGPLVGLP